MFERVQMVNHGVEDILLPLAFDFGADFADIFQVRGTPRARRGTLHAPSTDGRRVQFRYTGLDDVDRRSCLAFSEPPARLTGQRAEFMFSLPKGKSVDLAIRDSLKRGFDDNPMRAGQLVRRRHRRRMPQESRIRRALPA